MKMNGVCGVKDPHMVKLGINGGVVSFTLATESGKSFIGVRMVAFWAR
jgi:hypothetical protein